MKGYLLLRRHPPKRIHHLDVLLEDCIALDDSFQRLVDGAVFLKRYYIESRYPDDIPQDVRPEEAAEAMTAASDLRDFVLAKVRMHRRTGAPAARCHGADTSGPGRSA